jgi:hypothetical protein
VRHHVTVSPLHEWLVDWLGCDPCTPISVGDWLSMPQQHLLGVVRGAVYHDGLGELGPLRDAVRWYPHDIWMWMLAAQWRRIEQEEAFVGRAAEVGDELGSRLVAARVARELMRVQFLLAREYWPYSKWFGTAYRALPATATVGVALARAIAADRYDVREAALVEAFEAVGNAHNDAGMTRPVDPAARLYHGRPFRVLGAGRFVAACLDEVRDPQLGEWPLVGSVDQLVDATDVLQYADRVRPLRAMYRF